MLISAQLPLFRLRQSLQREWTWWTTFKKKSLTHHDSSKLSQHKMTTNGHAFKLVAAFVYLVRFRACVDSKSTQSRAQQRKKHDVVFFNVPAHSSFLSDFDVALRPDFVLHTGRARTQPSNNIRRAAQI